jgi:hypothetical protein
MIRKTIPILLILSTLALCACSHETLKAPCPPIASLGASLGRSPCVTIPLNIAAR